MRKIIVLMLAVILAALSLTAASADSLDPHAATAYMEITFECGCTRTGTGAMIGRYGLLTAAHNLYCHKHARPVKTCDFLFGAKSPNSGKKRYEGHFTYRVYETFKDGYSSKNDIGYVIFETPVGDSTGWFAWRAANDNYLKSKFVTIMNYKTNARIETLYSFLTVRNNTQVLFTSIPDGGEGGPIFINQDGMEFPEVIGVYICTDDKGNAVGRRITDQVYYDMKADGAFN